MSFSSGGGDAAEEPNGKMPCRTRVDVSIAPQVNALTPRAFLKLFVTPYPFLAGDQAHADDDTQDATQHLDMHHFMVCYTNEDRTKSPITFNFRTLACVLTHEHTCNGNLTLSHPVAARARKVATAVVVSQ